MTVFSILHFLRMVNITEFWKHVSLHRNHSIVAQQRTMTQQNCFFCFPSRLEEFIHSLVEKIRKRCYNDECNYIILPCFTRFYEFFAPLAYFNLIADAALSHTNYAIINKRKYISLSTNRHTKYSTTLT